MTGTIFNIQRFSVNDGPGIRTTVFLKGCPLSCVWCHNPESQLRDREILYKASRCLRCGACAEHCPQHAIHVNETVTTDLAVCDRCGSCLDYCYAEARDIAGQEMSLEEVIHEIQKDEAFFQESGGGVTLSGGEPLMQAEFSRALLKECKSRGIHTTLDTCGFAPWRVFDTCRPFVDHFLFDLKIMDDAKHTKFVGVSNKIILENLIKLSECNENIVIRVPIIPGITDDQENIIAISEFVKNLPGSHKIDLLPYHHIAKDKYERLQRPYTLDISTPSGENMQDIKQVMQQFKLDVTIGG